MNQMRGTPGGRRLPYVLLASLFAASGGCAGPAGGAGKALSASATPYEPDIPVPRGFELLDRSSEDWCSGAIRYVRHCYAGRADKYAVRKFYRRQMPLVRWSAVADGQLHGRYTMQFRRGNESCTIVISDRGLRWFPRVAVDVIIGPIAPAVSNPSFAVPSMDR